MGRRGWMRLVAGCVAGWTGCLGPVPGVGQTHKVARPEAVVRAVGVYEWTGELGKPKGMRLVPVTLFIDGHVEDAAVYLSRPVPMALNQGTIYELDEAGVEKGLVDVKEARHVQIPAAADLAPYDDGWFGYGTFQAPPVPKTVALKKPTQQVAVNGKAAAGEKDPDRPSFSRRGAKATEANEDDRPVAGSPEDVKVDSGKDDKDDVDRPTLRRRPAPDPREAKKARKERDQSSVTAQAKSLNDDPDRPTIKRGKGPAEDELPVLNGLPADMKQMVAVSDAKRREPHPFARAWEDEAEHKAVLEKMRAVAQSQLVAYGPVPAETPVVAATDTDAVTGVKRATAVQSGTTADGMTTNRISGGLAGQDTSTGAPPVLRRNKVAAGAAAQEQVTAPVAKGPAKARPVAGQSAAAKARAARAAKKAAAAAPAAGMVLTGDEVKGFTLSYGGAATYVYTAQTEGEGAARRYVTLVAQDDGVNGLKTVMKNVTDAAHLDRTAWMRFVDVVDVEASNRASLLFELRGQSSRQFALYRVIGARADTVFTGGTTQ